MFTNGSSVKNHAPIPGSSARRRSRAMLMAVLAAILFQLLYAGWNWHTRLAAGKGLAKISPTSRIIERQSTMALAMHEIERLTVIYPWTAPYILGFLHALLFVIVSAMPTACVGLTFFLYLNGRTSNQLVESESRCRKCKYILRGLSAPICPECGETV